MRIKKGFVLREISDSCVVVPVGAEAQKFNGIIRLNRTGRRLWELLERGADREEMISAILAEYDVSMETAERDTDAFIKKAQDANILEDA